VSAAERTVTAGPGADTASTLRRLFDESFAAPVTAQAERYEDFLAIRVGPDRYGMRLAEIGGLYADLRIVPVPSPAAQLLGVVGIRGTMAPIYDLAVFLGYAPAPDPRWTVLVRGPQTVGFAFDTFDSHLKVAAAALAQRDAQDAAGAKHLQGAVQLTAALLPIIHLTSILQTLKGSRT
jgi:chemotaxis signal transduction protein